MLSACWHTYKAMKKITIITIITILCSLEAKAQEMRGAIGIHPINNMISWRSNNYKKHFWDYKFEYQAGSVSGVPFVNISPQVNLCWRRQNNEFVKFYWGIGLGLETFVPRLAIPLGIEFFPLEKAPQLSIGAEASPILISIGTGFSTTIKGDFAIRYYFTKKDKKKND